MIPVYTLTEEMQDKIRQKFVQNQVFQKYQVRKHKYYARSYSLPLRTLGLTKHEPASIISAVAQQHIFAGLAQLCRVALPPSLNCAHFIRWFSSVGRAADL